MCNLAIPPLTISSQSPAALRGAPRKNQFRVHERHGSRENEPESVFTWIGFSDGDLAIWEEGSPALPLDTTYIRGVFERYAHPLEAIGDCTARIELPDDAALLHMLYVPRFDVVPKDYLVWISKEGDPLVGLCAELVPPLMHLARVQARSSLE